MNGLVSAFVILHIRISDIRILKVSGRTIFTLILIFLVSFGAVQLFLTFAEQEKDFFDVVGSVVYLLFVLFATGSWIRAWPEADKMLNKASDYQREWEEKKHHTKK